MVTPAAWPLGAADSSRPGPLLGYRPLVPTSDLDALRELERRPLGLPAGLELEWLGVAGYRLTYEGVTILVDPYVSRVPLRSLILRRPALPDEALIARYIRPPGPVAGILVGHTHWD